MKQHVTKEQFNECSDAVKQRWNEYAVQRGFIRLVKKNDPEMFATITYAEMDLPTIGQMIEFLNENVKHFSIMKNQDESEWLIGYVNYLYRNKDLCDSLWEAVKEVLNK